MQKILPASLLIPLVLGGCSLAPPMQSAAGVVPAALPDGKPDPAVIVAASGDVVKAVAAFKKALAAHRAFARETDPPRV